MKEGGELPHEEGDAVREFKALREENFWSDWSREEEREAKKNGWQKWRRMKKKGCDKRKREEEKEENETGTIKIRYEVVVSVEAFKFFGQGRDLESCGDLSWEDPLEQFENWSDCELDSRARVRMVHDVTDVPVSPSSVVTEPCDVSSCCLDWEFGERSRLQEEECRRPCHSKISIHHLNGSRSFTR